MYSEIHTDYMYGPAVEPYAAASYDEGLFAAVAIDGWKTADDDEPGETIACVIMSKHGDIIVDWHNNGARMLRPVLAAIGEAKQKLTEVWNEAPHPQVDQSCQKLYYLKDNEGDLDLIRVNNWDDDFEQRMSDAYEKWSASENEFEDEFYGCLSAFGYDVDVLDCDTVCLS